VSFICDFEESVVRHVRDRGFDGVICGHIHAAADRVVDGVRYLNCGDWVDSCSAIVEHLDGRMEIVQWGRASTEPIAGAWDEADDHVPVMAAADATSEVREPA
jgi:hypothetical protein